MKREGFIDIGTRIFLRWLFEDLFYAGLPLVAIAVVYQLTGGSFNEFFMLKEWSFGAIVLLGAGLVKFVRLKVEAQQSRDPVGREVGTQLIVLALVVSVLVLALVVLREHQQVTVAAERAIEALQIVMVSVGAVMLLALIVADERFSAGANRCPWRRSQLPKHIRHRLESAAETLDYCRRAAQELAASAETADWQARLAKIQQAQALVRQALVDPDVDPPLPAAP